MKQKILDSLLASLLELGCWDLSGMLMAWEGFRTYVQMLFGVEIMRNPPPLQRHHVSDPGPSRNT